MCSVDSWQVNSSHGGFCWVFKDSTFEYLRVKFPNRTFVTLALMADALAVKYALVDAVSQGLQSLRFYSDSKVLIEFLNPK